MLRSPSGRCRTLFASLGMDVTVKGGTAKGRVDRRDERSGAASTGSGRGFRGRTTGAGMFDQDVNCRVCGTVDVRFLCDTANESGRQKILHHYRCGACGSVFVGNVIDEEELAIAYSTLDVDTYYHEIERENAKKMDAAIDHLKRELPLSASIIDIGAGIGLFVRNLYDSGFTDVSAHEISSSPRLAELADLATALYHDHDYGAVPSNHFDAVTLLDVAEHVPNPPMLFDACARILKPGGLLYLHTPVVTRTDRIRHFVQRLPVSAGIGAFWQSGRTSIFHLENYTRKSLALLLRKSGFIEMRIDVINELSWPVHLYVRTYLVERTGVSGHLAPFPTLLLAPLLKSGFFNANKAVVSARKPAES